MMTLASYLTQSGTSQAKFAQAVSVEQPTVSRWLNGARPSWEKAILIENVTNGAVPVAVWAGHSSSPSSVSTTTDSLPQKDVGSESANVKGAA